MPDDITPEMLEKVYQITAKYKSRPGALIPVLQESQIVCGYLPIPVQRIIARELNIPGSDIYGVVTFYSFFTMEPKGRHIAKVCLGTACYVLGGGDISNRIQNHLQVG
ncbi:MAG: NAD(P)H-dependent oxidoreductase subunit E, partial [Deltaproteobacteria bacterium]|nr:NAD(P)H-dependent oxidoreductase subunit E [Deltaproteobacteria bacterium]